MTRGLDLDDISAVVSKDSGRNRGGDEGSYIKYTDPCKGK
jgi:hypothetical protein